MSDHGKRGAVAFGVFATDDTLSLASIAGTVADRDPSDSAETILGSEETADIVRAAIGGLTLNHQAVIIGRHYDEMTFRELAIELEISEPAAHKLYKRACARLKQSLELMGVDSLAALTFA